jgi:hypothetical protein
MGVCWGAGGEQEEGRSCGGEGRGQRGGERSGDATLPLREMGSHELQGASSRSTRTSSFLLPTLEV